MPEAVIAMVSTIPDSPSGAGVRGAIKIPEDCRSDQGCAGHASAAMERSYPGSPARWRHELGQKGGGVISHAPANIPRG